MFMKKNYKLPVVLILIITLIGATFNATAADHSITVQAQADSVTKIASISGTLTRREVAEAVAIIIKGPAKTPGESYIHMDEVLSKKDGSFELIYKMEDNAGNGTFTVTVSSTYYNYNSSCEFEYNGDLELSVCDAINAATVDTIANVLVENNYILNLDLDGDYNNLSDKLPVYQAVTGKKFSTIDMIRDAFEQAVLAQKSAEEIIMIIGKINTADITTISDLLIEYSDKLFKNTSDFEDYTKLINKTGVLNDIISKSYNDIIEIQKTIHSSLAIPVLNEAGRESIEAVLLNYDDIFHLAVLNTYIKLEDWKKTLINKEMVYGGYTDINSVKSRFNTSMSHLLNANSTPPNRQPSGGGGGGSVRISISSENTKELPDDTSAAPIPSPAFVDLDGVDWAKDSINQLADRGIINGYGDKTFRPFVNVKREEFVKMLVLALNLKENENKPNFKDVKIDEWYNEYIAIAYSHNIIKGKQDGSFGVGEEITRQEMTVMSYRAMISMGKTLAHNSDILQFVDQHEISDYAKDAVSKMHGAGLIKGVGDGLFAPGQYADRAMAAKLVCLLMQMQG